MPFRVFLAAALVAGTAPCRAAFRSVPSIQDDRQVERDEEQPLSTGDDTAVALTEALGDSINHTYFPKDEIKEEMERFRKRLDAQLLRDGSDVPLFNILKNAAESEKLLSDGYRDLIRDGLLPLARCSPKIAELLRQLRQTSEPLGGYSEEIGAVAVQTAQAVAPFSPNPPEGGSTQVDAARLERIPEELPRQKQLLVRLRELARYADRDVDEAEQGPKAVESLESQLHPRVMDAYRLDKKAEPVTANKATGRSSTVTLEQRSGRVLQKAAARLEAAKKKTEQARKKFKGLTDPDPDKGMLAALIASLEKAIDAAQNGAASGLRAAAAANRRGPELLQLKAQYAAAPDDQKPDILRRAQEAFDDAKQSSEAAQKASDEARVQAEVAKTMLAKAEERWQQVQDRELGRLDNGESDLQSRLPFPLPDPFFRAQPPRESPQPIRPKVVNNQKSKAITYPRALQDGTDKVIENEFESGSNLSHCTGNRC